jgi:hypothetical protein
MGTGGTPPLLVERGQGGEVWRRGDRAGGVPRRDVACRVSTCGAYRRGMSCGCPNVGALHATPVWVGRGVGATHALPVRVGRGCSGMACIARIQGRCMQRPYGFGGVLGRHMRCPYTVHRSPASPKSRRTCDNFFIRRIRFNTNNGIKTAKSSATILKSSATILKNLEHCINTLKHCNTPCYPFYPPSLIKYFIKYLEYLKYFVLLHLYFINHFKI